jgi:hypothetical protein
MGYRFSIVHANAVGHLINGNTELFAKNTFSSKDNFDSYTGFIGSLIESTAPDFYSSKKNRHLLEAEVSRLQWEWNVIFPVLEKELQRIEREKASRLKYSWMSYLSSILKQLVDSMKQLYLYLLWSFFSLQTRMVEGRTTWRKSQSFQHRSWIDMRFHSFLYQVRRTFLDCRFKVLLLPGFERNELNVALTSPELINELVKIHPDDSCIILQLKDIPSTQKFYVLDAFPSFQIAYRRIEQWPGVLVWDGRKSIFLPIKSNEDLIEILNELKKTESIDELAKFEQQNNDDIAYLFHISDLHFGKKISNQRKLRLISLLEEQRKNLERGAEIIPIITGDLVNSPTTENLTSFSEFIQLIEAKNFRTPIHILGNHDLDPGFFKRLISEKAVITSLTASALVEIIPSLNLAIVKFDSNKGGKFAQGKIGEKQFIDVGGAIEAIPNRDDLTFLAILHHHPVKIDNPVWYDAEWYERWLGKIGYEYTMKLDDSTEFLNWIKRRGIKYVLHGHKHIPIIQESNGTKIIAAGSATGMIKHKEKGKTYLSYNVIKYNKRLKKPVSCSIYVEEDIGGGASHMVFEQL